jgi:endo-1,4-beta-xylanase
VNQTKNYFAFGAALNHAVLQKKTPYENYKKFFLENFEWATLETSMKWWNTEPERVIVK